jgi:hypothetical protein
MTSTGRWKALRWFADHAVDVNDMIGRGRPPTSKMRNLMIREGQLARVPLGSFGHAKFELTPEGCELLANKHKKKRRRPSIEEQLGEAIP